MYLAPFEIGSCSLGLFMACFYIPWRCYSFPNSIFLSYNNFIGFELSLFQVIFLCEVRFLELLEKKHSFNYLFKKIHSAPFSVSLLYLKTWQFTL